MRPSTAFALATGVAALGGFLFGYDTAVIAGAVGSLREHFALSAAQEGWVSASAIYGCLPGALFAGFLADRVGRKRLLLLCAVFYAVSGIWSAFPGGFREFLAARFLGGVAIGISSMVCPTYIAEIAPERKRGFLDTMGGGNLSLQVHPLTDYIHRTFGMAYTQDESYYLLDAGPQASVFLGLKTGVDREAMLAELAEAERGGRPFDAARHVNEWPARKHDHVLIPAGTVHCSGADAMVLEISATPYIFTFKLWDWGRPGLDGLPRPVNLAHGAANIQWDRQTEWVRENLLNRTAPVGSGEGWREERTGLHELEFIETRRHWFTGTALHHTGGTVHVLNLVDGAEAIVESPDLAFEPFVVHYAETFVVPAAVGAYTIRPHDTARECATVKAFVRNPLPASALVLGVRLESRDKTRGNRI